MARRAPNQPSGAAPEPMALRQPLPPPPPLPGPGAGVVGPGPGGPGPGAAGAGGPSTAGGPGAAVADRRVGGKAGLPEQATVAGPVGPNGAAPPGSDVKPLRPPRSERRGPRVVQGKRTRQVIRRIDAWTVLKLSFLFYLCVAMVLLIAGVALWNIAASFNVIHNVEKFIRQLFDLQTFTFNPGVILRYSLIGSGVLVLLGTGANVLMILLYNLISDVIGGVQVIVLEEQDA